MSYPPDDLRGQNPGTHVALPDLISAAAQALQPGANAASKAMGYLAAAEVFRIFSLALPREQKEAAEIMQFSVDALRKSVQQGHLMLGGPS